MIREMERQPMKHSRLLKSILSVSGVLILVKVLGFIKQMVIAAAFGANTGTDLINLSYGFIGNAQYLLVQVMLTAVVSVYIHTKGRDEGEAGRLASDAFQVSTILTVALSALLCIFSPWIARFLAPTYSPELSSQLGGYIRLFSPMLIPLAWMAVCHALLNANKRFIPGQLEGLYQSVILVAVIALGSETLGVDALTAGYWLYVAVSAGILGWQARRYFGKRCGNPFRNPHIRQLLRMTAPLLIGYGVVYINQMVDKILVSGLESGTVTAMSYAAVLSNLVGTLIGSLCSVLYAHVTEHISKGNEQEVSQLTERTTLVLVILLLPVTVVAVSRAEDLVQLVYGRGAFDQNAAVMTAQALAGYCLGFIPLALREVYSRIQYGYQDSKRPTINSLIGIAFNIVLSILLCPRFGVLGVTFASSAATLVIGVLNMHSARRDAPFLTFGSIRSALPFLVAGGALSALVALECRNWFEALPVFFRFCASSACVFLAYFLILIPFLYKSELLSGISVQRK